MAPNRCVILDDTSPEIKYNGSWFSDLDSQNQLGNFGPPYLHTLRGTSVDGTVEFEFDGTAVEVWGTNNVINATTAPDPTLECFIDGVSIGRDEPLGFAENNWRFCRRTQLQDGHHTLRIDVKVVSNKQTFWLDQLRYIPSPNLPLDNKVILFDNNDPAIQLDSQWTSLGETANMTTHKDSFAKVDFIGTSISWVAFIPAELPHTEATGTWAIDGDEATAFHLLGLSETSTTTLYNQFYFTTPQVEAGPHTLTITFLGDNQTTPLCLDFIYVQNGTFLTSTSKNTTSTSKSTTLTSSSTTSPSNSTTTPDQTSHDSPGPPSSGSHSGAILGGILGGLALLVVIVGCVLFWKRWKARRKENFVLIKPSKYAPTPFHPYGHNRLGPMAQIHQSQSLAVPVVSASAAKPPPPTLPERQQLNVTRKQREAVGRVVPAGGIGHTGTGRGLTRPRVTATKVRQRMDRRNRQGAQPIVDTLPH